MSTFRLLTLLTLLTASATFSSASVVYSFDGTDGSADHLFSHLQWQFVSPTIIGANAAIAPSQLFDVVSPFPIAMVYVIPGGPAATPGIEVTFGPNAVNIGGETWDFGDSFIPDGFNHLGTYSIPEATLTISQTPEPATGFLFAGCTAVALAFSARRRRA